MKKILALTAAALFATTAQAALLTSWENDAGGFTGFSSYSTTTGVTDGSYAISKDVIPGWNIGIQSGYNNTYTAALAANQVISVDVTITAPVPEGLYFQIAWQLLRDTSGSTADVGYTSVSTVGTTTVSYDYSSTYAITPDAAWTQIRILTNSSAGYSPGTIYLDNLRLTMVPEPTALVGLSATGLLLLRRRHA